jgi:hypothetical protein
MAILKLNRQQIRELCEIGELAGAVDLRSPGSCRSTIRVPRQSAIEYLEKLQSTAEKLARRGERPTKRARIAPTRSRRAKRTADREASNELFSRDFSDEKEIHSTPTSSREHANTVGDRFRQCVRSSWFGDLLRWRARTSYHTDSGCDRNACANSQPVSNLGAAPHPSAPVR